MFHLISFFLIFFPDHFRVSAFLACVFLILQLINVSIWMIQVLCNASSCNLKSKKLQDSMFGTSIPCEALVLRLSSSIFFTYCSSFFPHFLACIYFFNSMWFVYILSWCMIICSETAMPGVFSLSKPQQLKSLFLYRVRIGLLCL